MRGVFDERDDERAAPRRDTELTLGSFTLLAIFFGLVVICGLFFGLGYAIGHRGDTASPAPAAATVPAALQVDASRTKPSAAPPSAPAKGAAPDADSPAAEGAASGEDQKNEATFAAPAPSAHLPAVSQPSTQPVVQAALPAAPIQGQNGASGRPQAAMAAPLSIMVQIAALSHQEDADVLVAALRRRGYVVTTHRDAGDGLIHVRLGPFASLEEASKWRSKLLNDGYNAIVE